MKKARFIKIILSVAVLVFLVIPQVVLAGPYGSIDDVPADGQEAQAQEELSPYDRAMRSTDTTGIMDLVENPVSGAPAPEAEAGGRPQSIPDSFDVNQLKTEGQKFSGKITVGASGGIVGFFVNVIDLLVKIIGSLSLLVFIIGALLTIASEGKEDLLEKGKNAMLYAIIGLLVSLFSFIIVTFIQSILF